VPPLCLGFVLQGLSRWELHHFHFPVSLAGLIQRITTKRPMDDHSIPVLGRNELRAVFHHAELHAAKRSHPKSHTYLALSNRSDFFTLCRTVFFQRQSPPFFAGKNPRIQASLRSISPQSCEPDMMATLFFFKVPSRAHSPNRGWQYWSGGSSGQILPPHPGVLNPKNFHDVLPVAS